MTERRSGAARLDRVFLAEAEDCLERARYGADIRYSALRAGAAASAIWASCAAVEAFVSEREIIARRWIKENGRKPEKKRIKRLDFEPRVWRRLNRLVGWFHKPGLKSHPRYRDLHALMVLREFIGQPDADHLAGMRWPEGIKKKHRDRIPARDIPEIEWASRVLHEETASWAVMTATEIMEEAGKYLPDLFGGRVLSPGTFAASQARSQDQVGLFTTQSPH